jgi:hypothetical protein
MEGSRPDGADLKQKSEDKEGYKYGQRDPSSQGKPLFWAQAVPRLASRRHQNNLT